MNKQDIIDWVHERLATGQDSTLSPEMQVLVDQDTQLQQQLALIHAFYQERGFVTEQPSRSLDSRFYQMLDNAKSEQKDMQHQSRQKTLGFVRQLHAWFMLRPAAQFAAMGCMFVLGFSSHYLPFQSANQQVTAPDAIDQLQKEMSSLTSVVALSLLRHPSASERLNGVAYSRQANFADPELVKAMLSLLQNDSSVSVRLAVLQALKGMHDLQQYEVLLLQALQDETNPMLQLEISQLLLNRATDNTKAELFTPQVQNQLHPDVLELLAAYRNTSII